MRVHSEHSPTAGVPHRHTAAPASSLRVWRYAVPQRADSPGSATPDVPAPTVTGWAAGTTASQRQ
ncbi:hypothetical protein ACQ1ZK_20125, partial [Enterococcus faecium]